MDGLLTQERSARGDCDDGGDAWVHRRSRRRTCKCIVSVKRAGFHITGPWSRVPGGVFRIGGLASEGVLVVWSCRYNVWPSIRTYYSSVWVHGKTLPLQVHITPLGGSCAPINEPTSHQESNILFFPLWKWSTKYSYFCINVTVVTQN